MERYWKNAMFSPEIKAASAYGSEKKIREGKENLSFCTPQHVERVKIINSSESTPEQLRKIFSPPPGFDNIYKTPKKLNFVDEKNESEEEERMILGEFRIVKFCEKCRCADSYELISSNEVKDSVNRLFDEIQELNTIEKLKNTEGAKCQEYTLGELSYIQELQKYIRQISLSHVKNIVELQNKYKVEITALQDNLNSTRQLLQEEMRNKENIIHNLTAIIKRYNPKFMYTQQARVCNGCIAFSREISSKEYQLKELQSYIRNIDNKARMEEQVIQKISAVSGISKELTCSKVHDSNN